MNKVTLITPQHASVLAGDVMPGVFAIWRDDEIVCTSRGLRIINPTLSDYYREAVLRSVDEIFCTNYTKSYAGTIGNHCATCPHKTKSESTHCQMIYNIVGIVFTNEGEKYEAEVPLLDNNFYIARIIQKYYHLYQAWPKAIHLSTKNYKYRGEDRVKMVPWISSIDFGG